MARRCSHCSNNGHNSRTCPVRCGGGGGGGIGGGGVKLFGVRLTDGSIIKKSASMGNLSLAHYHSSSSAAASPNPGSPSSDHIRDATTAMNHVSDGYLSDDPTAHASCSTNRRGERKKGIAWTEEEHRMFLLGLQKMGKGDWRGIARNYVTSRTPTQVASHAQKYFIRHSNLTRRKRRSSLFDMVPDTDMESMDTTPVPEEHSLLTSPQPQAPEADIANAIPSLDLSLELVETTSYKPVNEPEETTEPFTNVPPLAPAFYPAYVPVLYPIWPQNFTHFEENIEPSHHQVLKPIPVIPKEPVNVDELVGMSKLNLEESKNLHKSNSELSLKLLETSRQSAFHANTPASVSDMKDGNISLIQPAVLIG